MDAVIDGVLDLSGASVPCPLTFINCIFTDTLSLIDASIPRLALTRTQLPGVRLNGATFGSSLTCRGMRCLGVFAGINLTVPRQLILDGAHVIEETGSEALQLDGATVGALFARGSVFRGRTSMVNLRVTHQMTLDDATFVNSDRESLVMDLSILGGAVFARGIEVVGSFTARNATVAEGVSLEGARLLGDGSNALSMNGANVSGNVDVIDTRLVGAGQFIGTRISGELVIDKTACVGDPENGISLDFESSEIGSLTLTPAEMRQKIDLTNAAIGVLTTDGSIDMFADLTGWSVENIRGPLHDSAESAIEILERIPPQSFSTQPWHVFADYYARSGQPEQSRRVLVAASNKITMRSPWRTALLRTAYRAVVGYGHHPMRAAWWLGAIAVLGWLVISGVGPGAFVPAIPSAIIANNTACPDVVTAEFAEDCVIPTYPSFDPLTYAVSTITPAGALTTPAWTPVPRSLTLFLTVEKLVGWLLTALLLAGVTGLLRRR